MLKHNMVCRLFYSLIISLVSISLSGQVQGDYRTLATGNWNSNASWQVYNGSTWKNCSAGDYPGSAAGAQTVNIRNNHTISVTADVPNSIASLMINGGNQDSYIRFTGSFLLRVTGLTDLYSNSSRDEKAIFVDNGIFRTGSLNIRSIDNNRADAYVRIEGGEVTVDTDISMNNTERRTYILFTGEGSLYIGGSINGGYLTANTGGGTKSPDSGTVIYNGSATQNIGEYTYYNLKTDNAAGLNLTTDITVSNSLIMTSGNISVGANILILEGAGSGNLIYTSGTIIGSFQRAINVPTGIEYLFPTGTSSCYNPLKITFNDLTSGDLTVSFQSSDIESSGLPLADDIVQVTDRHDTGYWTMSSSRGLASVNYDIAISHSGFTGIDAGSRIIKRTDGANLGIDGIHGTVTASEITRTGMNGISTGSTDTGIGESVPLITSYPEDYSGCDPLYTVVASGVPTVAYQWQEDKGSGFSDIINGGIYNGANSATLTITGATELMTGYFYRCIITDGTGSSNTSNSALFTYSLPVVNMGYDYLLELTLGAASGSGDLTDFPALISFTNVLLRSEANGGHVSSGNGYDIIFTDANGSKLDHQMEYYDPVTGEYVAWVRIPVLPASATTTIYMKYGNSTVSADPSVETVWTSNYKGVWHLQGTDYNDATQYSNDGTNNATINTAGIIADGKNFNGSTSYVQVTTNGFVSADNNQTISIWAKYSTIPSGVRNLVSFQNAAESSANQLGFRNGNTAAWKWEGEILANGGSIPSTNTWHYYVFTFDGTTSRLYVDGVEMASSTVPPQIGKPSEGNIGRYNNGEYIAADLDEVRFSMTPKSDGWILTEYNNQVNPSGFITVGTETSNTVLTTLGSCSTTFALNQGTPAGGTYSGPGVSGTNFNASEAGPGTHTITYNYTAGSCSNSVIKDIIVTPPPAAPLATDMDCCETNIRDLEATGSNLIWYSDPGLTLIAGTGTPFATGEATAGSYTYYVTQTVDGCESSATEVSLSIHNDIVINTQPGNQMICEGDNANITIDASGYNLTYQWQANGSDISDGGIYTGTNTGTLVITDPGIVNDGNTYRCVLSSSCGTPLVNSNEALLTVTPRTVASFSYTGNPYCPTDPDPFPVFSGGGVAGTFSSAAGLVFVSTATGEVDIASSTPGIYTVSNSIAATGGCGVIEATDTLEISSGQNWTGAVDTDWNEAGNWSCNYIPVSTSSVTIPDVPNKPLLSPGTAAGVKDIVIETGASLTITGNTIIISGNVTNNGTFTCTSGTVKMNGSGIQNINAGLFENNTIQDLIIDNPSGVSLEGPLFITGVLYPENGTLNTSGFLTLASDASATALISGTGDGSVLGNVTMQRYLPERFGYKYISSPFQSSPVNELGDDTDLTFWYPAVHKYDESRTNSGWVGYNDPSGILEPMHGYSVNFGSLHITDTIDITGTVNNGAVSLILYNNNNTYTKGFNLVGNPYPSPIDWDAVSGWTRTNIDNAVYYFESSSTDEYGGTYRSYVNGISSDGVVNNIIPSMQGFFVHVSDGVYPVTATLGMDNDVRINDLTHAFTKSGKVMPAYGKAFPLLRLRAVFTDDPGSEDLMVIYGHDQATAGFDRTLEAFKLLNTDYYTPNLYSVLPGMIKLSINALPFDVEMPLRIPLGLKLNGSGTILFNIRDIDSYFSYLNIFLFDNVTGIKTRLQDDSDYQVTLGAGEYNNRFYLDLVSLVTDTRETFDPEELFSVYAVRNILRANVKKLDGNEGLISVFNINGQIVSSYRVYGPGYYEFFTGLQTGIYIVNLRSGSVMESRKIVLSNR